MNNGIIFETKRFLVNYLKDKKCDYEQIHPWRKPWEFVALHSFRVESYVIKLLQKEPYSLSQAEIVLIRIAAILHDIGRLQQREDHAIIGRKIVEEWIQSNNTLRDIGIDCNRLLHVIETHSNKDEKDEDYCSRILKDADILDEIGVISIFMASSWIDRGNPYFFTLLNQRVGSRELSFCDEQLKLLNTDSAKQIMLEKKEFIQRFYNQLQDEIGGTAEFGAVTLEDYFFRHLITIHPR